MKRVEEERKNRLQINNVVQHIKQLVFQAATNSLTEISSEPFEGCKYYHHSQFSLEACEYTVSEIKSEIIQMFPDSDLSYDDKTKKYTLKWD
jgi:ABC-type Zn uptake system ZnuABC Zn-binding protein ZnuA